MSVFGDDYIELTVQIEARYRGTRIQGPCLAEEEVKLTVPYLIDPKFVNFPKIMEGLIPVVFQSCKDKVGAEAATKKDKFQMRIWGREDWSSESKGEHPVNGTAVGGSATTVVEAVGEVSGDEVVVDNEVQVTLSNSIIKLDEETGEIVNAQEEAGGV